MHEAEEPEEELVPRAELEELGVEVVCGRQRVLSGVRNTVRVLLRINAPQVDPNATSRPNLNVACVMDCSTSMQGQKLDFAKRAVLKLVKHLVPGDVLHLVTYDSLVQTIFENGDLSDSGKDTLRVEVMGLRAAGQTNLFGGLERAAELLSRGASTSSRRLVEVAVGEGKNGPGVQRIFLFSDGCVNAGLRDPGQIKQAVAAWAETGVTTSTFGIGTDFDEPLMRDIAVVGKGRYFYLGTARDIPKLVSKSVHELLDLYATETVLEVRGGVNSIVSRLYGGQDDEEGEGASANSFGLMPLGDLHCASERKVLVELEVAPAGNSATEACFVAAEWTLTFQQRGCQAQFSGQVELRATRDRTLLGDEAIAVVAAFTIQRAADLDYIVSEHLARGDSERAREAKAQQLALLQDCLQSAQREDPGGRDVPVLARVLERARRVAEQIEDRRVDRELMRRQCVQEMHLNRCMSDAGWGSGCDSDDGGDVGNLGDLSAWSPPDTPPGSPRVAMRSRPRNIARRLNPRRMRSRSPTWDSSSDSSPDDFNRSASSGSRPSPVIRPVPQRQDRPARAPASSARPLQRFLMRAATICSRSPTFSGLRR